MNHHLYKTKAMEKYYLRTIILILIALLSVMGPTTPAVAECSDPPEAEVNWRRCYVDNQILDGANLNQAQLRDATFARSSLKNVTLISVDGFRSKFISADLSGASLQGGNFAEADFTKAVLAGADLSDGNFRRANFFRADLSEANLSGADFEGTRFIGANLTGATWVDGERVCGPNSIGRCN